jgi:predicted RNA-binding Zn-ribbon protein involved in translation (DUF1610 family)
VNCPNCLVKMEFEDVEKRGKIFVCPDCGREVIVRDFHKDRFRPNEQVIDPGLVPVGCIHLNPIFEG